MPTPKTATLTLRERATNALRALRGEPKTPASSAGTPRTYPQTPFATWSYEDAAEAVTAATEDSELDAERALRDGVTEIPSQAVYDDPRLALPRLSVNRAFFDGDHWQKGAGWIGPHPLITDIDYNAAMDELVAAFTSKNVVREVVKRHASGVLGKAPTWSFVPRRDLAEGEKPSAEEEAAITRANSLMRRWFTDRKCRSLLHDAVCTLLFAARSPLRLYIPAGLLAEQATADGSASVSVVRAASIEEALSMIWPDHPTPEHAAVVQHDDTKMEAGVRLYEEPTEESDQGDNTTAPTQGSKDDTQDCVELVYINTTGETVIRVLCDEEDKDTPEERSYSFDFGARLTMMEMRRDPLITPQVTQAQRALNLALSMLPRNVITGGFLERVLLNAQMPGHYERDAATGEVTGRFIREDLSLGAGTTNFFAGVVTKDAMGNQQIASPDVKWRDPVPVDAPIAAAEQHYQDILDETSQLHVILSGEGSVSGKSRDQARAEYLTSLSDTEQEVVAALRFILETPLAMAEALCGKAGELTRLVRIDASCRLDLGPLSAAERAGNEASIGKTLSQETAMSRNGVDDVDAERTRMASDPMSRATLLKAQGDALTAATTAGLSIDTAAEMLGLDAKTAAKIKKDLEEGGFAPPQGDAATGAGGAQGSAGQGKPADATQGQAGGKAGAQQQQQGATGGAASQAGGDA